jgi:pimeloyl-ACP methyl ester carboxylesterase
MNTKWLLVLAGILGILVLVLGFGGKEQTPTQPQAGAGQLVDAGHFVLERGGAKILDESYTLFFHSSEGYMLLSQSSLYVGDQVISLAQQTQYDRDFVPFNYQLAADTATGTQIVSAQLGIEGLTMEVRVGSARQTAVVRDTTHLALLDNNVIGHYAVLWDALRVEALGADFTAAVPQALLSLPARAEGPTPISFRSGSETYDGKLYDVHVGDTEILLVEYEGRFVALQNLTQDTIGYDVDLFPNGVTLLLPSEETPGVAERDIAFASGDLTLMGTLALPQTASRPLAAALFIQGSGPVDRDGNAAGIKMDAYRQLAVALAQAGIASFRFDKRGVGESQGDFSTASRDDLVADLHAALDALRAQPEVDPGRVFLIGHSEGGYLAPILAVEDPTIAGIVLLEAAGRSLDQITRWQVQALLQSQGASEDQIAVALQQEDQYIAFVKASTGQWSDYTSADLEAAMPWLTDDAAAQLLGSPLSLPWLREYYNADPQAVLRQVRVPVLAINGEKDLQVPSSESEVIRDALEEGGDQDVTAIVFDNLNHLLRYHPEAPSLTVRHIDQPVDPRVVDAVIDWATAHFVD